MKVGEHIGKYCDNCNTWFSWVQHTPEVLEDLREPPKSKELF
jgi:hypothetical protein